MDTTFTVVRVSSKNCCVIYISAACCCCFWYARHTGTRERNPTVTRLARAAAQHKRLNDLRLPTIFISPNAFKNRSRQARPRSEVDVGSLARQLARRAEKIIIVKYILLKFFSFSLSLFPSLTDFLSVFLGHNSLGLTQQHNRVHCCLPYGEFNWTYCRTSRSPCWLSRRAILAPIAVTLNSNDPGTKKNGNNNRP